MSQHQSSNTCRLLVASGTWGDAQIVASPSHVLVDLNTRNYDTAGHLHRDHALASLSLSAAARLRDLLAEAVDHANSVALDIRQTALWSDPALTAQAVRFAGRAA
jgi:hypothetical protein